MNLFNTEVAFSGVNGGCSKPEVGMDLKDCPCPATATACALEGRHWNCCGSLRPGSALHVKGPLDYNMWVSPSFLWRVALRTREVELSLSGKALHQPCGEFQPFRFLLVTQHTPVQTPCSRRARILQRRLNC
eukprot:6461202-Amphidinium_carterae.1